MADQPSIFTPDLRSPVAPGGRSEPRLWVRRLAIFKDPKTLIRDVPLKPGLNIIWTPDMSSTDSGALAHGSGKTTFCRLLRACLGEADFATEVQRERIMTRLPDGLIAAEAMIEGGCWVTVRPLGLPGGDFVVQAPSIEAAIERGHLEDDPAFIDDLLNDRFFSKITGATPPEVDPDQVWDVFRAWLTRDQECRLGDILAWRSSKTHTRSRAQVLGETAKLTMVRLALRALDAEERKAAARERDLLAAAEQDRRRQTYKEQRHAEGLKAVRQALGVGDDVAFDDELNQKGLVSLAEAALAEAIRADLPKLPDVGSIFKRLKALSDERDGFVEEWRKYDTEAHTKRTEAERCRSEAELGEIDIAQGKVRVCPVCRVSIDEALATGCGISLESCDLAAVRNRIDEKKNKAAQLEVEASGAEQKAKQVSAQIQQIEARKQSLEDEAKNADAVSLEAQKAAKQVQDKIYQARRTLDDVRSLRDDVPSTKSESSGVSELDTVRSQLDQGRKRARSAIRTLEEQYQGIMAAWLPDGVEGAIKLDGRGLKVDAQFSGRGEVSTAALDSLKIVAFDLAALHMAIEEKADLPAFLIHDSPREADLDGHLYARLFTLVRQWEEEAAPCFQYIVTTTTAPPKELQGDDFVKLKMSSTPAEQRLFGMDL